MRSNDDAKPDVLNVKAWPTSGVASLTTVIDPRRVFTNSHCACTVPAPSVIETLAPATFGVNDPPVLGLIAQLIAVSDQPAGTVSVTT